MVTTRAASIGICVVLGGMLWGCADGDPGLVCGVEQVDPLTDPVQPQRVADFQLFLDPRGGTHPDIGRPVDAASVGDRIAVADGEHQRITVLDASGGIVAHQGGGDDGRQGYVNLNGVVGTGTSFVAFDDYLGRLTVLDLDGRVLRLVLPGWERPPFHSGRLLAATDEAALVEFRPSGYNGDSSDPVRIRAPVHLFLVELKGDSVLQAVQRPGEEEWAMRAGQANGGLPVIFGHDTFATLAGGGVWLVDSAVPALDLLPRDDAAPPCTVPIRHAPVPVIAEWVDLVRDSIDRAIDAMVPGTMELDDGRNFHMVIRDFNRQLFARGLPANTMLPYGSGLRGSADGALWVREFPTPGAPQVSWTKIDPVSLHAVARVAMDARLRVLDVSPDRILAFDIFDHGAGRLLVHEF